MCIRPTPRVSRRWLRRLPGATNLGLAVPRQRPGDGAGGIIGDAGEQAVGAGAGIDVTEASLIDQPVDGCRAAAAVTRATISLISSCRGNATDKGLGGLCEPTP